MSSYANVAASSGPIGAEKVPKPVQVEHTDPPSSTGNIETVSHDKFQELKKRTEAKLEERNIDIEKAKKDAKDFEKKAEHEINDIFALIKKTFHTTSDKIAEYAACLASQASKATYSTAVELQNPVVALQVAVGLSGIAAGYVGYLERNRIRTDSSVVLGLHGAIITGLVGLDYYLFTTYYPKYDKKKSL